MQDDVEAVKDADYLPPAILHMLHASIRCCDLSYLRKERGREGERQRSAAQRSVGR